MQRHLFSLALLAATSQILPANASEAPAPCSEAFGRWMLEQQQQFSNRKLGKVERRKAERAIDAARAAWEKDHDFCAALKVSKQAARRDPRFNARFGEVHDFVSSPDQPST